MERAPTEVARYFHAKYGFDRAREIISGRLEGLSVEVDTVFWNHVMETLEELEGRRPRTPSLSDTQESAQTVTFSSRAIPRI